MKHRILVLGLFRSGTTLTAEMIHHWGAYAGPEDLLLDPYVESHPLVWEYQPLHTFNKELLQAVGGNPHLPLEHDAALQGLADNPKYRDQAEALIAAMDQASDLWFWKDPYMASVLPFWHSLLPNPVYVITLRNPLDSARSMQKRVEKQTGISQPEDYPAVQGFALYWQRLMLSILTYTAQSSAKIFVEYERLLQDPVPECRRLATFLEAHCGPAPREDALARMAGTVQRLLWHNKSSLSFLESSLATEPQKNLYRLLQHLSAQPSGTLATAPFDPEAYPMPEGWRDFLHALGPA